ncbi:MAG: helix-turn-helix domain-containing protein [Ruminococcaceae bacterium]|nr:helix-turn-helix domain-containing protein [Oscillospiraceae bacterium]
MEFITVKQAAEKWGVSTRRVQVLCAQDRVKGAYRFGRSWMIPEKAVLPNAYRTEEEKMPMPRRSPFLDMTDLYNKAGGADECAEMLINRPEAYALFEAQLAYRRGEIDKVYDRARFFLSSHSGFYAILGGGMLLAQCAIWRGDFALWTEAKKHICEAPCQTKEEREIISLSLAIIDSSVYDNKDYPEWFKSGNFETLPADAHPAAKVFYVKYLYMAAYAIASGKLQYEGAQGLAVMKMIPNAVEPLITQSVVDKTVIPEIFLRMSCAVAYHNSGEREKAIKHIDKAIALALPDKLYGILTEYIRHFNGLLEERLLLVDERALNEINELYDRYRLGWARLSGQVRNKQIATNLTPREHEVAKLKTFGFKPKQIGEMLYLSESMVRYLITQIANKAGCDEDDFSEII